jgi:hypothetical protein
VPAPITGSALVTTAVPEVLTEPASSEIRTETV